jgi:hypothetical protein
MLQPIKTLFEAAQEIGEGRSLTRMAIGSTEKTREKLRWCIFETARPVDPEIAERLLKLPGVEVLQSDLFDEPIQWGNAKAIAKARLAQSDFVGHRDDRHIVLHLHFGVELALSHLDRIEQGDGRGVKERSAASCYSTPSPPVGHALGTPQLTPGSGTPARMSRWILKVGAPYFGVPPVGSCLG